MRHIFWASFARLQTPWVKQYQDEYFSRVALVLDNDVASDKYMLFEEAVSVAAGFAMVEHGQDLLLDMLFVGGHNNAEHILTGRAIASKEQMLESLATLEVCEGSFLGLSIAVQQQSERICGCILIFTTWDDVRQSLVQSLRALSVPVVVLLIHAEHEKPTHDGVISLCMGRIQADLDALSGQL